MIYRDNKVFRFAALAAIIFMVTIASAGADEIILQNGDRITGTITSLAAGKLKITPTYANSISISTEQVVGIRSDTPVTVKNKRGEVLIGKLKTTEAGKIVVEQADGRTAAVIDWNTVTDLTRRLYSGSAISRSAACSSPATLTKPDSPSAPKL